MKHSKSMTIPRGESYIEPEHIATENKMMIEIRRIYIELNKIKKDIHQLELIMMFLMLSVVLLGIRVLLCL